MIKINCAQNKVWKVACGECSVSLFSECQSQGLVRCSIYGIIGTVIKFYGYRSRVAN